MLLRQGPSRGPSLVRKPDRNRSPNLVHNPGPRLVLSQNLSRGPNRNRNRDRSPVRSHNRSRGRNLGLSLNPSLVLSRRHKRAPSLDRSPNRLPGRPRRNLSRVRSHGPSPRRNVLSLRPALIGHRPLPLTSPSRKSSSRRRTRDDWPRSNAGPVR